MPRERSPNRDKAKEIYLQHNGKITLQKIAAILGVSDGTVRGWKTKDKWEAALKGLERQNNKRSEKNTERSKRSNRKPSLNDRENETPEIHLRDNETETNSPSPFARFGNKNAIGNKGGPGGPKRNKHAMTTGEFETLYYNELSDDEKNLLSSGDYFFENKYFQQILLIKDLTLREYKIQKRIQAIENTKGGMFLESISKTKGNLISENPVNKKVNGNLKENSFQETGEENLLIVSGKQAMDNATHLAKHVYHQMLKHEEALTRIKARKQRAIEVLHKMETEDIRLDMDKERLELYKQRIAGKIDLNTLFAAEDLERDLSLEDQ